LSTQVATVSEDTIRDMYRSPLRGALVTCKTSFIHVGIFSFFINLLMLTPMFFMMQVFDRVVASGSLSSLAALAIIAVFLLSTMGFLEWARSRVLVKVGTRLDLALSDIVYEECFAFGRSQEGTNNVQPLNDLTGLRQYLAGNAVFAFFDLPWLPIYMALLFVFHPLMGFWGCFAAAVLIVLAVVNERVTKRPMMDANEVARENLTLTERNLRNVEVVSSMGMLGGLHKRWREKQNTTLYHQEISSNVAGSIMAATKTFRIIAQLGAMGMGAFLTVSQWITPGTMIAGALLMSRALSPIESMISAWRSFSAAKDAYFRLDSLLDGKGANEVYTRMPKPKGRVTAHAASVLPPSAKVPTINDVTFDIPPGSVVGVIGPSGSGKTTLIRGILGTWRCAEGSIRIDGVEAHQYRREDLGPSIGYLPQDIELFDGTISENIARFTDFESDDVIKAAKAASIHGMVLEMENGYDTLIGPGGLQLSAGQRQRVALARALYQNPSLVILDEPNSNLDEEGEKALHRSIRRLREAGSTVVVVSHRKQILGLTNILIFVVKGSILSWGQRSEVLKFIEDESERRRGARQQRDSEQSEAGAQSEAEATDETVVANNEQ